MALDWSSVFGLKVHSEPSCGAHMHSAGVQSAKNLEGVRSRLHTPLTSGKALTGGRCSDNRCQCDALYKQMTTARLARAMPGEVEAEPKRAIRFDSQEESTSACRTRMRCCLRS